MEFEDAQKLVFFSFCFISFICSFFIVLTIIISKIYKTLAFELILRLSVCNLFLYLCFLFSSIKYYGDPNEYCTFCQILTLFTSYFCLESYFWTTMIGIYVYLAISNRETKIKRIQKYIFLFIYLLPLPFIVFPIIYSIGNNKIKKLCWIAEKDNDNQTFLIRFSLFFLSLWLCLIINFIMYYKSYVYTKKINLLNNTNILIKTAGYIIAMVLCWMPIGIIRIILLIGNYDENTIVEDVLESIGLWSFSILGCVNFKIFYQNPNVKNYLNEKYNNFIGNKKLDGDSTSLISPMIEGNNENNKYDSKGINL